jgi:hypothetical protein
MKLAKALRRDNKISKRHYGMKVENRNILLLEEIKKDKAKKIKEERENAEAIAELTFTIYDIKDDNE